MTQQVIDGVAIVTGAGRGIGRACALWLAEAGARVVVASRNEKELSETARHHESIKICPTDVAQEAAVQHLFEFARSEFSAPVDFLINNAGYISVSPISETTAEEFDRTINVNLRGTFLCSREMFRQNRPGHIVNISSLAGIQGMAKFPGFSSYSAAKAGVVGLTECLAVEGQPFSIYVNCLAPGAVQTKMLADALPDMKTPTEPKHIAAEVGEMLMRSLKGETGKIKELTNE